MRTSRRSNPHRTRYRRNASTSCSLIDSQAPRQRRMSTGRSNLFTPHLLSFKRPRRPFSCRYNSHRPHRGIDLNAPEGDAFGPRAVPLDEIERTAVVGGLISEYNGEAA